jgi:hypothetical protein
MTMKPVLRLLILLCVPIVTWGQFSRVGTSAAQFLKFPADARTAALGGATLGMYGDVTSMHWNPAGIASIRGMSGYFSYARLYADITYDYAGAAFGLSEGSALGIGAFYLDSGEMEQTTIQSPDGTGAMFKVRNYALNVSYARYMTEWLMAGISVKYIREEIWHESSNGVAVDIGSVLETGFYGVRFGISVANFGTEMQMSGDDLKKDLVVNGNTIERGQELSTDSWPLPVTFRAGIALDVLGGSNQIFESQEHKVTLLAAYNEPSDSDPRGNYGLEYGWNNTLFARGGYYQNYDATRWSAGMGVKFAVSGFAFAVDYAYVDYRLLDAVHMFSVGVEL